MNPNGNSQVPTDTGRSRLTPRRIQLLLVGGILIAVPIAIYAISAVKYSSRCGIPRDSCLEHRKAGCTIDGDYNIQLGSETREATCDMHTDGGGWTLVLNYLRRGSTTPSVTSTPLRDRFPLQDGTTLGMDETHGSSWGHLAPQALSQLSFKEMRFRCRTTSHERLMDFVITDPHCLDYFRTGKGFCVDPQSKASFLASTRRLPGHQAALPQVVETGWKDQGDNAMTNYPFFADLGAHYWSIATSWNRFECDDREAGGTTHTWHQVWVR